MKKENKEPEKEIGVKIVLYWIFIGLFALLSGVMGVTTIQAGHSFIGILFFVLCLFLFVPKKYLRITGALRIVIFLVVCLTLLYISGANNPAPEQKYEYYLLGQPFNLTSDGTLFSIVIQNTSTSTNLTISGIKTTTSGFYLFVNGKLTNTEKTSAIFNLNSELRDSQNNSYNLLAVDLGLGNFQPGLERPFYHIFEIPKTASGLKFSIKDKNKVIKVVDLER